MENIATQKQLESLRKTIQTELLKRGFTAPIGQIKEKEYRRGGHGLEFESEPFQTVPVIFEKIVVNNFSTSIRKETRERKDGTEYNVTVIWVQVHVSYQHFGGGSNGCNLFTIVGDFYEDDDRLQITSIG